MVLELLSDYSRHVCSLIAFCYCCFDLTTSLTSSCREQAEECVGETLGKSYSKWMKKWILCSRDEVFLFVLELMATSSFHAEAVYHISNMLSNSYDYTMSHGLKYHYHYHYFRFILCEWRNVPNEESTIMMCHAVITLFIWVCVDTDSCMQQILK